LELSVTIDVPLLTMGLHACLRTKIHLCNGSIIVNHLHYEG